MRESAREGSKEKARKRRIKDKFLISFTSSFEGYFFFDRISSLFLIQRDFVALYREMVGNLRF
jgi:hypothetical protein